MPTPTPIKISALTTGAAVNTPADFLVVVQGGVTYKIPVSALQAFSRLYASLNTAGNTPSSANVLGFFCNADGVATSVEIKTAGTASGGSFRMTKCLGTVASPSPVTSATNLGSYQFSGWDSAAFSIGAQIVVSTAENWTTTAHGSRVSFINTKAGTTSTLTMLYNEFGNLVMTGQTDTNAVPSNGHLFANAVIQAGNFGGLYAQDGVTVQSIPNGATYTKLTCFNTAQGGNTDASFITPSNVNSKVTPLILGRYRVTWDLSMSCATPAVTFNANVFLNGVEQKIEAGSKNQNGTDEVGFGATGYVNITSLTGTAADLDLRLHHDNGGAVNVTPIFCHLNVERVGN